MIPSLFFSAQYNEIETLACITLDILTGNYGFIALLFSDEGDNFSLKEESCIDLT